MKKLLLLILPILAMSAIAYNHLLMNYQGGWSPTVQYAITPISGTNFNQTPVVESASVTYVVNGSSAACKSPLLGESPAANPTCWDVVH